MSGLAEVVGLAAAAVALGAWVLVVLVAPGQARPPVAPGPRAARARLWLYAPVWVPLVAVGATLAWGLLIGALGWPHHCQASAGAHHHLCLLHPPAAAHHGLAWALTAAVALPALWALLRATGAVAMEARLGRTLARSGRPAPFAPDVQLIDRPEPMAATVGLWRPKVVLTTGLAQALSPAQRAVVVAHERAHVARRDTASAALDHLAAALLPWAASGPLLRDLALAREQACDAAVARSVDPLAVAATLTAVARLNLTPPPAGLSAAGSALEARVAALLTTPRARRGWWLLPVGVVLGVAAGSVGPLHDAVELFINHLLH